MVQLRLSGSNDSMDNALEVITEYVLSKCNVQYGDSIMSCDKNSLKLSNKPIIPDVSVCR